MTAVSIKCASSCTSSGCVTITLTVKCSTSVLSEEHTMGCTSSTQTTAQDTTRPKHDGCTAGTSNENGDPAADSETIPDLNEEVQCSAAASAHAEPEAAAAESNPDQPESNPSTTAENTEDPAPSENTTEDQAESSPPEETPASGQDS